MLIMETRETTESLSTQEKLRNQMEQDHGIAQIAQNA